MKLDESEDDLLDVNAAKQATKSGHTKLYRLMNEGQISAVKIGKRTFFWKSEIQRYLEALPEYPSSKKRGV